MDVDSVVERAGEISWAARVEEAEGSGDMFVEAEGAGGLPVRRDMVRPTELHVLCGPIVDGVRTGAPSPCPRGCGAIVWLEEAGACCKGGKNILGEAFNPPIDAEYLALLQMRYMSEDSRHLNAMLSMATQGTSPSRKDGGIGLMQHNYGHCCLLGKTYLAMYNPHHTNSALDNFKLPRNLLLDTATQDMGPHFARRLLSMREYLHRHHPMARHLMPIDEVPGERLNFDSYLRMEAHSTHTGRMELAFVDTGVPRADEHSNKVMYFDLRKHQQGLSPTRVSQFNALFETLQFPLLFEKGIGGFFYKRQEDGVQSTTGQNLTLQMYTQAMLYQNRRLHYLGRLGQEYALVMHSRHVEYMLNFQRSKTLQGELKRRRDAREGVVGDGTRVSMSTSVVGSKGYVTAS